MFVVSHPKQFIAGEGIVNHRCLKGAEKAPYA
jgi:hypothetical protein